MPSCHATESTGMSHGALLALAGLCLQPHPCATLPLSHCWLPPSVTSSPQTAAWGEGLRRLVAVCTDTQVAGGFPVFPILPSNPSFSNLNATLTFHFLFISAFSIFLLSWYMWLPWIWSKGQTRWSLRPLPTWYSITLWYDCRPIKTFWLRSQWKLKPKSLAALESLFLFGYLTRTALLNLLNV